MLVKIALRPYQTQLTTQKKNFAKTAAESYKNSVDPYNSIKGRK